MWLKAISKTIAPEMMTVDMFVRYFDKWRESSTSYSPNLYQKIVYPFLNRDLSSNDIIKLIKSNNPLAQYYAVQLFKINNQIIPLLN